MRAMPNMTVIDPCDALDIEQMVPAIAAHKGTVYARLLRGNVPAVLDDYDCRFRQVGLPDAFLDAGALPTLHDRYGISTSTMSDTILGWLA